MQRDPLLAILPEGHPLTKLDKVPLETLCHEPFMLLEKGANEEVTHVFTQHGLQPRVHFTTWDDYAIMSMVESGLGVSMLPQLILRRIPYRIVAKEVDVPAYRTIAFAVREGKTVSLAVKRFMEYLKYREM